MPTSKTNTQYAKNKKPWVYPIIIFGQKILKAYFKGIVMAKAM